MSSYYYVCVLILMYKCPHTTIRVLILLYACPHTTIYASIQLTGHGCNGCDGWAFALTPRRQEQHSCQTPTERLLCGYSYSTTTSVSSHIYFVLTCVSSYYYIGVCRICVLILLYTCLLYVCPRTTIYVSVVHVSSYYYIRVCCMCVLVLLYSCLLYVCPRTTIYVTIEKRLQYQRRPKENVFSASTA